MKRKNIELISLLMIMSCTSSTEQDQNLNAFDGKYKADFEYSGSFGISRRLDRLYLNNGKETYYIIDANAFYKPTNPDWADVEIMNGAYQILNDTLIFNSKYFSQKTLSDYEHIDPDTIAFSDTSYANEVIKNKIIRKTQEYLDLEMFHGKYLDTIRFNRF